MTHETKPCHQCTRWMGSTIILHAEDTRRCSNPFSPAYRTRTKATFGCNQQVKAGSVKEGVG